MLPSVMHLRAVEGLIALPATGSIGTRDAGRTGGTFVVVGGNGIHAAVDDHRIGTRDAGRTGSRRVVVSGGAVHATVDGYGRNGHRCSACSCPACAGSGTGIGGSDRRSDTF